MHVDQEWGCVCMWQSEIFYAENTIQTRHVNGYVKKGQSAFKRKILRLPPHSSVNRGV